MKLICAFSALCCFPGAVTLVARSPALVPRARTVSPYSSHMKRKHTTVPHPLIKRQDQTGDTGITDIASIRFLAEITFGDQTFLGMLDTGSSDTWMIQSSFTCYDPDSGNQEDQSWCNYGPGWQLDSTFTEYTNVNFRSQYGSGATYVQGPLGYTDVTLAGLTIPSQTVGAPDVTSWTFTGEASGFIGMAFPSITNEYDGSDGSQDNSESRTTYPSLFQSMFIDDTFTPALEPYFSLAISRDESNDGYGGTLTIGGIPDPTDPRVNSSSADAVTAPLVVFGSGSDYSYYAINVDSVWTANNEYDAGQTFIVDSGAPGLYLPADVANAFNAAWAPASTGINSVGQVVVDCAAASGGLCIGIGGQYLCHNDLDLVVNAGSYCYSAVQSAGSSTSNLYILGDPFLKNVLAVYDWGSYSMEFYSRPFYDS